MKSDSQVFLESIMRPLSARYNHVALLALLQFAWVSKSYAGDANARASMLDGLTEALSTFGPVLWTICIFVGVCLIGYGLLKSATMNKPDGAGSSKPAQIVATLLTGAFLVNLAMVVRTMSLSMGFTTEAASVLSDGTFYTAPSGFEQYTSGINFAFAVIQVVGALALVRGIMIIKKSTHGGGGGQGVSIGHAATHLIGGTLALNIKPTLEILGTTMGGDASSIISLLLGNGWS